MKRTTMVLLTTGGLLLAGCATAYEKRMQAAHVGKPADGFLARAGKPDSLRENSDGSKVLTWYNKRQFDGFYGPATTECVVTIRITSDGLISSFAARGPDCRSS